MDKIIFYKNEETGIVNETSNFQQSIFRDQYAKGYQLFRQIYDQEKFNRENNQLLKESHQSNIIAFCGDRGEGKTSCMRSFCSLLERSDELRKFDEIVGSSKVDVNVKIFETIDPAFFDQNHNLVELILGRMFGELKERTGGKDGCNNSLYYDEKREERELLLQAFGSVKTSLAHLGKKREDLYDSLEELDFLSAGLNLRSGIKELFERYLKYIGKELLVIPIDDLDLNIVGGYEMVEQIRKYLSNVHCVLLLAVKIDQLEDVIQTRIKKQFEDKGASSGSDIKLMAEKYVTKLIPYGNRINMPHVRDLSRMPLVICNSRAEEPQQKDNLKTVQEFVAQEIFKKTRYLFYNSADAPSYVVPSNLRSLRMLLGMLDKMPDFISNKEHRRNKEIFKNYFFSASVQSLNDEHQRFVEELISLPGEVNINKYVVKQLSEYVNKDDKKTPLLNDIISEYSTAANVSLGDVMFVIRHIERKNVDEEVRNLLFVIKSFYSMRLYEYYDEISENEAAVYPKERNNGMSVYRVDAMYEHTNVMQNFLNGAYYTFEANDLIAPRNSRNSRDTCCINGKNFAALLKGLKDGLGKYEQLPQKEADDFKMRFKLAEFFILTTTRSVESRRVNSFLIDRNEKTPAYLRKYNSNIGYYRFNFLSIFYNLTNPEYAYKRFKDIADIYESAKKQKWSLLKEMMKASSDERGIDSEAEMSVVQHSFMSCVVIRNIDILQAMFEQMESKRWTERDTGETAELIARYYESIMNMGMQTYPTKDADKPYKINFAPLKAVAVFLKDVDRDLFNSMFEGLPQNDDDQLTAEDIINIIQNNNHRFPVKGITILDAIRRNKREQYNRMKGANQLGWVNKEKEYQNLEDVEHEISIHFGIIDSSASMAERGEME